VTGPAGVLVLGAGRGHELRDGDRVLRTPLPLSRRIAVTAVAGGSGTSAVAASVAGLLGRRRRGSVLAVDASGGSRGLGWQLGVTDAADRTPDQGAATDRLQAEVDAERRRHARSAAQARAGLPTTGSGLPVLALRPGPASGTPVDGPCAAGPRTWAAEAGPIARFFDVVVTDWGVRPPGADLVEVAAGSHVLALVTRADRWAASTAAAVLPALRDQPDAPRLVLVLVDVCRTPDRVARRLAADLALPVCWVPYDAARAADRPQDSRTLRGRTRRAQLRLGVTLLTAAQQDPTRLTATRRPSPSPAARPLPVPVPVPPVSAVPPAVARRGRTEAS
jgi:MinD-like ATPase involved in chromosome partitioning or flagellar assembly